MASGGTSGRLARDIVTWAHERLNYALLECFFISSVAL